MKKYKEFLPKQELIKRLKYFYKKHNRRPVAEDCYRGLLPSIWLYLQTFGSWRKALLSAGFTNKEIKWQHYHAILSEEYRRPAVVEQMYKNTGYYYDVMLRAATV